MKKFHIVRLGCPKNDADMDILRGIFESNGYLYENDAKESNFIIIDTCGFIEPAKKESIETIFDYISLKKYNQNLKVIAVGCLIERYYKEFKEELKEIDGLFGVIPPKEIFDSINNNVFFKKLDTPYDVYSCEARYVPSTSYAFVKIGDGCSRKCAFCSIPYFKGEPTSREIMDIKSEVEFLVKNNKKEIILVSQDDTLYGVNLYKKQALPELLKELNSIEGDFWIRVMYLHPDFLNDEIISTIHALPKVLNYFDVPMQHGSSKILTRMGRVKELDTLKSMIKKIRSVPSIIRTSIVVGFPGENKSDFEQLLDFIDEVEFDRMGAFTYSREEDTPAYNFDGQVDEETKNIRYNEVMKLQKDISESNMSRYVGNIYKVLIEEFENDIYIGRTFMDAPDVDGSVFIKNKNKLELNEFYSVKIIDSTDYDLYGEII